MVDGWDEDILVDEGSREEGEVEEVEIEHW